MLKEKLERHGVPVWLVNTGWTGGPYGVGKRMALAHTRALLRAALTGQLADVPFAPDPVFGLAVPATCPGVPDRCCAARRVGRQGRVRRQGEGTRRAVQGGVQEVRLTAIVARGTVEAGYRESRRRP